MKKTVICILSLLVYSNVQGASKKWFCAMPTLAFQDSQGNQLFRGVLAKQSGHSTRFFPVESQQEYDSVALNNHCVNSLTTSCRPMFFSSLANSTIQSSMISAADCLNKLQPAQKVSVVCHKEYFTQSSLNSVKRLPKIGNITAHFSFSKNSSALYSNPTISNYPVDCQYF